MNPTESLSPESQHWLAVWNAAAPPIRPSPEDVEAMARWWAGDAARVLVQGVTPELVDLAVRRQAPRVIAMDQRAAMFPAMRCLAREDWAKVEALVCDWRTFVPELEGALDLILGDGSLTMVAFPEDWRQIFLIFQRYLVPGGHVVMRLAFQLEEPLIFDPYLERTLARFDAECLEATPEQRAAALRELVAEVRLAIGFVSAGSSGAVDFDYRANLMGLFRAEMEPRVGHWKEWEAVKVHLPPETEIRKGVRTGKAMPSWEAAVCLMEENGFIVRHVEQSGTRPAPGVFRVFSAERKYEK